MLPILNKLFFTFIFTLIIGNSYSECLQTGEIRYFYNRKEFKESASYCFNSDKSSLISQKCEQENCLNQLPLLSFKLSKEYKGLGTPGFILCRKYLGVPQIIEFKVNDKWYTLDRCTLNGDKDLYIDTGSLLKFNQTQK